MQTNWVIIAVGTPFVLYSLYNLTTGSPVNPIELVDLAKVVLALDKAGVDPETVKIVIEAIRHGSIK